MIKQLLAFLLLLPFSLSASARNAAINAAYKIEAIPALAEATVSEAVRKSLDEKGIRVLDEKGKPVCEVWFRKSITTTKDEAPGANFAQIGEGNFVGAIHFPASTSDFRGQGIKAGYYTLRFGLILQDGNHLGVSPARDFFLLCPVGADKDPNTQLKTDDMVKLSRNASGTGHPTGRYVAPATSDKDLPKINKNEHEHVILETKISTKSGPLAIGIVVIGKTEG